MNCVICKNGNTQPGLVTVTLERENCIVILKEVPAEVCENCGEYYLSDGRRPPRSGRVTEQVLKRAETAINNGAEVEIIRYAA
ncbi:MAG: type II toxin-antitoxin system MqsA family antitoxin [Gomphosphaeria aponina SAG 52.96 = DSM 107014]|uniref:Type II toxin-antitoxin system MqsA family antitoxin n=1 Tax=Gomphosphaeria aponina SAG 52.96 = DSM 107014 TaxID=1521640 RepID=A0A941GMT4_9CHRO|nr:type II toxin-antitoxin system MqsA family antitoxin [Gomphosphaeria aponina SAG 52.96 = DSM 107014]